MAEPSKDRFDPDATVRQPASAAEPDPDATVQMPALQADPDATFSGPAAKLEPDPESTVRGPLFDPDATLNPGGGAAAPAPVRQRKNPFAPSAPLSSLQTSLAALGGLNPLVEMANPILGAVPQIRHSLRHPDPARLRAMLRDQIDGFQSAAEAGGYTAQTVNCAADALCALLDESAGSTPWGAEWKKNGVAKDLGRAGAADAAFAATLQRVAGEPGADADLVEFLYICLALGFEGRRDLDSAREKLHDAAALRRPRPAELSERWRSGTSAEPDFLFGDDPEPVAVAAPAPVPAPEPEPEPVPLQAPLRSLSPAPGEVRYEAPAPPRLPRAVVVRIALGVAAFLVVAVILVLRIVEDDGTPEARRAPPAPAKTAATPAVAAGATLAKALEKQGVAVSEAAGRVTLTLRAQNQFGSGAARIDPALHASLRAIGQALDGVPGAITVVGYADAVPVRGTGRHASNQDLSLARAQSAAAVIAAAMGDPRRVKAEGKGDAEPVAPSDTPQNRARNRRVAIVLSPAP